MAYQSVHTGPEVDAAASLLDEIQEIRDESNANKDTVVAKAAQVEVDADRTVAAAAAMDGVVEAAESARNDAATYRDEASQHAADADSARALAVVARNGAEAAEAGIAQHAADAQAAATTAGNHASNAADSETAAATSASTANSAKAAAESARDAAQGSASSAATDAGRAETAAASVDGVVAAAESARDAAQGYRNESLSFRDQAAQSAIDAENFAAGNILDDGAPRDNRAWSSDKTSTELGNKVDKVAGKGLSTNDYTNAEKTKLAGVEDGAQVNPVPVDNLTTPDATQPLSANQGRVIKGLIDAINTLLLSDDSSLDELQEIVDYIKLNRAELDNLGIGSIAGLQSALDNKQPLSTVLTNTTASFTSALLTKLNGIQAGAQVNSVTSVAGKTGAVSLAKGDVGLGNVDNTSDADKPVSNAVQQALNAKVNTSSLATVATSGSYVDLLNKPSIPTIPGVATTSSDGLMSAADKTKLNAVGTMANRNATISTGDPSGGANGDMWFKVE